MKFGNISFDRLKLDNLYTAYYSLTPSQQTIALIAAAFVAIMIIILPVTVASSRIGRIEREAEDGKRQFKDVVRAIDTLNQRKSVLMGLQQTLTGGFDSTLSSTIESVAETSGIKDKIDSLKEKTSPPSETFDEASVDVRLKKVSLKQLIDFLYSIEHQEGKVLRLKQLAVKTRFDNKQELDSSFTVSTFRLLEGAAATE